MIAKMIRTALILMIALLTSCHDGKHYSVLWAVPSPDRQYNAVFLERFNFDRNFEVRIDEVKGRESYMRFRSPDEGGKSGTEHIFWNRSSSAVLLTSSSVWVEEGSMEDYKGRVPFLLMDFKGKEIYCNDSRQTGLKRFDAKTLERFGF